METRALRRRQTPVPRASDDHTQPQTGACPGALSPPAKCPEVAVPTACSRPAPGPSSLRKREGGSSPRRPHEQAPPTKPARPRRHANVALALNTTPKLASPTVRGEAAATAVSGTPQSLEPSRNRPAALGSSCPPGGTALAPAGPVWASPPCSHLASGLAADTTCQSTLSLLMTGEGQWPGREETSPSGPTPTALETRLGAGEAWRASGAGRRCAPRPVAPVTSTRVWNSRVPQG